MRLSDALLMAGDDAGNYSVADVYVGGYVSAFNEPAGNVLTLPLNSLTGGLASAPAEGDLVLVTICVALESNTPVTAVPSGWTDRGRTTYTSNSINDLEMRTFYKVMGASVPTSIQLNADRETAAVVGVMALRHIAAAPFPVAQQTASSGSTAIPPVASIANTLNRFAVVSGSGAHDGGTGTFTDAGGDFDKFLTAGGHGGGAYDLTLGMGLVDLDGVSFSPSASWTLSVTPGSDPTSLVHHNLIDTE